MVYEIANMYDHKSIEQKWNDLWFKSNIYKAEDFSSKPKKYILVEFPYPSGSGLHCGHAYRFTMPDVYSRKLRMDGNNVLFPIGWDAFGLPAENYAVQTGVHPAETTRKSIDTYRKQMRMMGYGFDWDREVNTTDPKYYKWTQWIFLKFFEAGLAELREQPVWWCEKLRTVLANEEVLDDGKGGKISERGEHPVEKRMLKQWILKMPAYAEKLLAGLETIDFPQSIKIAQREWIGRSEGATIRFPMTGSKESLEIFTTRPDTILGVTFMVVAPEHPLIDQLKSSISNFTAVNQYREQMKNRSELDRKSSKEKSGIKLEGVSIDHPLIKGFKIPLFVADYVLMDYGTGAIMAVPGHDERDFEFAKAYGLPIPQTVTNDPDKATDTLPFVSQDGFIIVTDEVKAIFGEEKLKKLNGRVSCAEMTEQVIALLEKQAIAERKITFKIRDWLFSRQRYWGEPIPLLHLENGKIKALAETSNAKEVQDKLPLVLPQVPDYLPSADGTSPLSKNKEWVNIKDESGLSASRETNTMPNWAGSCWYYLRYLDPKNDQAFADPKKMKYWLPVDRYFGGSEHTTLHLLYSRFWHIFLYDLGLVPTPEPYSWRQNGGILLGSDGQKMSKSVGNVVNPDDKVESYGADALRLYINFMGPYDATLPWNESGLKACRRLIERIFELRLKVSDAPNSEKFQRDFHKCVRKVTQMVDSLKTNTAVSEFMILVREAEAEPHFNRDLWNGFIRLIAPFVVFAAEELWQEVLGNKAWDPKNSVHLQAWPKFDEHLAFDQRVTIGVQVNGKMRAQVEVDVDEAEAQVRERVMALEQLQKWVEGKELKKFVYVPGRIVNLVVAG